MEESFLMPNKHETELKAIIKGDVQFNQVEQALFSTAACIFRIVPQGVVAPRSPKDVLSLVQYALNNNISLTPRAGGSSLAGQSIGEGVVIDFKRYMDKIIDINLHEGWVKVEPGLIYNNLNLHLKPLGFFFPPDPSSGNFCCLGGMAGTNGAGPHTLKYGATKDNIVSLTMITGHGNKITLRPMNLNQEGVTYYSPEEEAFYHRAWQLLSRHREMLTDHNVNYNKNSCGYNIWEIFSEGVFDLTRLVIGSEGTLGIITDLTLRMLPLPKAKAAALIYFSTWATLGEAVSEIVNLGASALEVMDKTFLNLVRNGSPHLSHLWPDEAEAILLAEFEGETLAQARELLNNTITYVITKAKLANGVKYAEEEEEQAELWALRKAAYPLLYKADKHKKPMNFIDDAALPLDKLDIYLERLRSIFAKYNLDAVIYGHAGNGNLHVNPLMDPHDSKFQETLKNVANEGFNAVIELGGTITGEHGDGILRAPYIRKQYGKYYEIFKEIKSFFDPKNILNPGKILTDANSFPLQHLRYKFNYRTTRTVFDAPELRVEIEKCHGCGTCRDYCPVAQHVTMEEATARAKANILTAVLNGEIPIGDLSSNEIKKIADLCYNCKRCLTHCPTSVNIPHLAVKIKELYTETHKQNIANSFLGNFSIIFDLGTHFPTIANALGKYPLLRNIMEKLIGIDKRRLLPTLSRRETFKTNSNLHNQTKRKVIYFPGCFSNFSDPRGEGKSTIHILESNGIEVVVPGYNMSGSQVKLACCGVAKISLGSAKEVIHDIRHNIDILSPYVASGYSIITSSPSCGLTIKKEWPQYLPDKRVYNVSAKTYDLIEYLTILEKEGELNTNFQKVELTLAYHNPCHMSAQGITKEPVELLKKIPGITVIGIEDSCSGMAGSFGMKHANFDLSMKIGQHLFDEIKRAGVTVVATGCGTCQLQVRQGTGAKTIHPANIIAQAYGFKP